MLLLRSLLSQFSFRNSGRCLVAAVLFCAGVPATSAQIPQNDICSGATIIPGSGPFPYLTPTVNITEALDNDGPGPVCQTNVTRGVWYRITPATTGVYQFSTCDSVTGTTEEDTVMLVYENSGGCNGTFTPVACVDDNCRRQSEIQVELEGFRRYYVVVWQFNSGADTAGDIELRVNRFDPPDNETCAVPAPLTLGIPETGSTIQAMDDHQLGSTDCFTGVGHVPVVGDGGDVVFRFIAPTADDYSFRVTDYSGGDLVLYLADDCEAVVTSCLGAANRSSASSSEEILCVPLEAGQDVFLIVDQQESPERATTGGIFRVEARRCRLESEGNDEVRDADSLACGVAGLISHADDWDFFRLGPQSAGSRVFAMIDGESASRTDFDLRITSRTNVLEYDGQDNDLLFGNFSSNIAGTPLEDGEAFILVTYDAPPGFDGVEPYHLYSVVQPPLDRAFPEQEPNEALILANASIGNYFKGNLDGPSPSSDVDYYQFDAVAGDTIFISLDADPLRNETPIDAAFSLLDSSGRTLIAVDDASSQSVSNRTTSFLSATTPFSPGEAGIYTVSQPGTYFVVVKIGAQATVDNEGSGDYLLSIAKNCFPGSVGAVAAANVTSVDHVGGFFLLNMTGSPGVSYRVQRAMSVIGPWETVGTVMADGAGLLEFEDFDISGQTQLYRAVWP